MIFICTFDKFKKDLYQYTFTSQCEEIEGLELNDEITTIYMNTEGHKGAISEECKMFLKAVKGIFTNDEFSAILEKEIEKVKSSGKWRKEYMNLEVFMYDERKKGFKEGQQEAKATFVEVIKACRAGKSVDDIAKELNVSTHDVEEIVEAMKQ